jgi:hypothetical protein
LRPHDIRIGIEVLRKPIIGDEGHRIQRPAATSRHSGVATTRWIGAVPNDEAILALIRKRQIGDNRTFARITFALFGEISGPPQALVDRRKIIRNERSPEKKTAAERGHCSNYPMHV